MKRFSLKSMAGLVAVAMLGFGALSCSDDDDNVYEDGTLTTDPTSVSIEAGTAEAAPAVVTVMVKASGGWKATVPAGTEWLSVSPMTGGKGDTKITFTALANTAGSPRPVDVTFRLSDPLFADVTAKVAVTQKAGAFAGVFMPISEMLTKYANDVVIADEVAIKGYVIGISNRGTVKAMNIQDDGDGVALFNEGIGTPGVYTEGDGATEFRDGDEVTIIIKGATIKNYFGIRQIYLKAGDVVKTGEKVAQVPIPTTVADIKAGKNMSRLVKLEGVQALTSEIGKEWAQNSNITLEAADKGTLIARVGGNATFAGTVPGGSGSVTGVANVYETTYQILPISVDMTGARFDGLAVASPVIKGDIEVGTATTATIELNYFGGASEAYNYTVTSSMAELTVAPATGTMTGDGTVVFDVIGTPATEGEVTFTIADNSGTSPMPATVTVTTNVSLAGAFVAAWDFDGRAAGKAEDPLPEEACKTFEGTGITFDKLKPTGIRQGTAGKAWGGDGFNKTTDVMAPVAYVTVSTTIQAPTASFTTISGNFRRSGSGATKTSVQYSLDGTTFVEIEDLPLAISTTAGNPISMNLSTVTALQNIATGSTVVFRFVPYGATADNGSWYVKQLNIIGQAK